MPSAPSGGVIVKPFSTCYSCWKPKHKGLNLKKLPEKIAFLQTENVKLKKMAQRAEKLTSKATPVQDKENIKHELSGDKKGGKNKKREPSSKATPVQDKENIKHELSGDKKGGKNKKREPSSKENIQHELSGDKKVLDETKKTNDEDYNFIVHGIIPPGYWKELAEKRQLGIEETAEENQELYEQISIMKTEVFKMKKMANWTDVLEKKLNELSDYLTDDEVDEVDEASCQQL